MIKNLQLLTSLNCYVNKKCTQGSNVRSDEILNVEIWWLYVQRCVVIKDLDCNSREFYQLFERNWTFKKWAQVSSTDSANAQWAQRKWLSKLTLSLSASEQNWAEKSANKHKWVQPNEINIHLTIFGTNICEYKKDEQKPLHDSYPHTFYDKHKET